MSERERERESVGEREREGRVGGVCARLLRHSVIVSNFMNVFCLNADVCFVSVESFVPS